MKPLHLLMLVGTASADFASRCYTLGRARIDPIVSFGSSSSHEHTFIGSDAISAWTRTGRELFRNATCTSCGHGDTSSYWFPSLFWDGRHVQVADASVYWSNSLPGTNDFQDIVLFPLGLRMIEGSPFAASEAAAAPYYSWYCFGALDEGHKTFPPSTCPENKMRLSLRFPSCWNRKDRYLPSGAHMAHPYENGDCPAGFVRTWSLRLEVDYLLDPSWSWTIPDTKFVLGTMSSAYATHADFFNGMPVPTQMQMMHRCGRLGGDYCNVRPDRYDCDSKYLTDHLPVPDWSPKT
jgi:hypothetical protein